MPIMGREIQIADLHIHSHYSVATSKQLKPEYLDYWARRKGISIVGTGDFTHPGWTSELKEKLQPTGTGLFTLNEGYRIHDEYLEKTDTSRGPSFMLTGEISNIYKKDGCVRKVHNLVLAPDFEVVEHIQQKLAAIGNITSDGRPILGLDSRDLLEIVIESSPQAHLIPAHIWTPWFSALGSKSGFDTISACYGDLADHIFSIETGLSSDPPMNWACTFLDGYTITSNSDAHSPEKLGREANLLSCESSYESVLEALRTGDPDCFLGTIEFFPQEGKYHYDGHRKCSVCWDPVETLQNGGICPVCGKNVTVGVMNRVAQLADRDDILSRPHRHEFFSLIPLKELLSEVYGVGAQTKKVAEVYSQLISKAGSEFSILMDLPLDDISRIGGELLGEGIKRIRNREVYIKEGFDGEYGEIKVFSEEEKTSVSEQGSLFPVTDHLPERPARRPYISFDIGAFQKASRKRAEAGSLPETPSAEQQLALFDHTTDVTAQLNPEQKAAVTHEKGPLVIVAGPGTGKTRTLTYRIAYVILEKQVSPSSVLALTFTNKAAREMEDRLRTLLPGASRTELPTVSTFHRFGLSVLRENIEKTGRTSNFSIADEDIKAPLLAELVGERKKIPAAAAQLTRYKQQLYGLGPDPLPGDGPAAVATPRGEATTAPTQQGETTESTTGSDLPGESTPPLLQHYQQLLFEHDLFDFDDLVYVPIAIFRNYPEVSTEYRNQYTWLFIDEYQDVNYAQYQLIRTLMPDPQSNLCVIGDPDQSIYSFRGADVRYIRCFLNDYPGAHLYHLTTSYRCSDYILRASEQVVSEERSTKPDDSAKTRGSGKAAPSEQMAVPGQGSGSERGAGSRPEAGSGDRLQASGLEGLKKGVTVKINEHPSEKSEAEFIARTIEQMIGGVRFFSMDSDVTQGVEIANITSFSDCAILCRISRQMDSIGKALNDHAIPFQRIESTPLTQREPVKSVLKLLRVVLHPGNSLLRRDLPAFCSLRQQDLTPLVQEFPNSEPLPSQFEFVIEYLAARDKHEQSIYTTEHPDLQVLLSSASRNKYTTQDFLRMTTIETGMDLYDPEGQRVALMTMHAAKGLEFPCVFIAGCEDGLLPYSLFENQEVNFEEERRLFYVGMTRAEHFLFLCRAEKRRLFGREYRLSASPFLAAIEESLTEKIQPAYERTRDSGESSQLSLF